MRNRQSGQTLVIALIILSVLLTLGLVFAGIVNRNIVQTGIAEERTVAFDLAEAGTEFAHSQLVNSASGADWRPAPTSIDIVGDLSRDPDAHYLRPGSGLVLPNTNVLDLGGPDGLGPYSRVVFDEGRALIRVRYAPSDFDAFADPTGAMRQPGRASNFIIIESVGRSGGVTTDGRLDPSLALAESAQVVNFADSAELGEALGRLGFLDNQIPSTHKLMAFASIGIIEHARFITNKDEMTRSAQLGVPLPVEGGGLGTIYEGNQVVVPNQLGGLLGTWTNRAGRVEDVLGGGSIWSNADVELFGINNLALNASLGDQFAVAGEITPASDATELNVARTQYDPNFAAPDIRFVTQTLSLVGANLDSDSAGFNTLGGVLRDDADATDPAGYPRSLNRKDPPRVFDGDALDRYLNLTRESGVQISYRGRQFNTGRFGFGRGVYVDSDERGNLDTEDERAEQGAVRSLPNDWLNPNNGSDQSRWVGPFYQPLAPYLRLMPDGFEIVRDTLSDDPHWRSIDWAAGDVFETNDSSIRYWTRNIGGQTYILNDLTGYGQNLPASVLSGNPSDNDFLTYGAPFNGVVFFNGDMRVRGVIPTDVQLTVAARGTIYVEGSITKGVSLPGGGTLNRPSTSTLALLARDYVTLNTTQFVGIGVGQDPNAKNAQPDTPTPVELDFDEADDLSLYVQFPLQPNGGNPATWTPFALNYTEAGGGAGLESVLLLSSAADYTGPSFVSMDVTPLRNGGTNPYLFPMALDFGPAGLSIFNEAADLGYTVPAPLYGMGEGNVDIYPRFETAGFTLVDSGSGYNNASGLLGSPAGGTFGDFVLSAIAENELNIELEAEGGSVPQNYLLGRAAVVPHDVRIEAALYAEEGSFFVIPGLWFNNNPQDTRAAFEQAVSGSNLEAAQRDRLERFGNGPEMPFYQEPLAVKITVVGSVTENMPAPMHQQVQWLQKWGWIPRVMGATGRNVPETFVPQGYDLNANNLVPNLTLIYDPALATASADGTFAIRSQPIYPGAPGLGSWVLPPMPKLPVSPTLAYFGEVN